MIKAYVVYLRHGEITTLTRKHAEREKRRVKSLYSRELKLKDVKIRETFHSLNLDMIDPSDSMQNFVHRMNFGKTKGFAAVERIDSSELYLV